MELEFGAPDECTVADFISKINESSQNEIEKQHCLRAMIDV